MRKLFLHMMVSLDGYIEGPNKELDWSRELGIDEEFEEYSNKMLGSIDGILLGRNVYEVFINYWPNAYENPAMAPDPSNPSSHLEAARMLHELPKYVLSTTLKEAPWNNSHIIRENIRDEIKKLKEKPGKEIALFGGAKLANSLMEMNLIDEFRLIVNPVILGGGTPLFREGLPKTKLALAGTRRFKSGAIILTYTPQPES